MSIIRRVRRVATAEAATLKKTGKHTLGIDPGLSGALVVLDSRGGFVDGLLMPVVTVGSNSRVNAAAVAAWLTQWEFEHAYIELVGSMPKQGVSSVFTFGHAAGTVTGVVAGALIPYTLLTPASWKKHCRLIGTDKDVARSRAAQLYPGVRLFDTKTKGQAFADATLIARSGMGLQS